MPTISGLLLDLLTTYQSPTDKNLPAAHVFHGHIVQLAFRNPGDKRQGYVKATNSLKKEFPDILVDKVRSYHVRKLLSKVQALKKSGARAWEDLQDVLQETYAIPTSPGPSSSTPPTPSAPPKSPPSTPISRRHCSKCASLRDSARRFAAHAKVLRHQLRGTHTRRDENRKCRKTAIIDGLRRQRGYLKRCLSRKNTSQELTREVRTLNIKLGMWQATICSQTATIGDLEALVADLQQKMKALEVRNEYLESGIADLEDGAEDTDKEASEKSENAHEPYDYNIRKCIYRAILCQVPVAKAGDLVRYVSSELGDASSASKAPSQSSVSRMAHEISVLSFIQACEILMTCGTATICWDATTVSTSHINELHLSTDDRTLTLSVARLPGGRAMDYANHINAALDDVSSTYGEYVGIDVAAFKTEAIRKINSTLSDRAPVNHCVVELLKVQLGTDLVELHCNLHPHDGFATHTRSALLKMDKEMEMNVGGRGTAESFIYSLSTLRYKQKGDPGGFKTFLDKKNIHPGSFAWYVGNRLHVLFRTAGYIIMYLPELKEYLEKFWRCDWGRSSLAPSLNDDRLVTQFRALGSIGKVITGPWMTLFYKNPQVCSNVEMIPFLKTARENISRFLSPPEDLVNSSRDVFGAELPGDDPVMLSLRDSDTTDLLKTYLHTVLDAISKVFDRQLSEYCRGPLSDLSGDVLNSLTSASPNNIWAERSLGMTDALMRKAPMATLGFVDAKVKAKTNGTLAWLDSKDAVEQQRLVTFAQRKGALLRKQRVMQDKQIDSTLRVRMEDMKRARDDQKRRAVGKKLRKVLEDCDTGSDILSELDQAQHDFAGNVIASDPALVGAVFQHTWYDAGAGKDIVYWGRIQELAKKKVTVGYWVDGQLESSSGGPSCRYVADLALRCLSSIPTKSPNGDYVVNKVYHNRNPRNLEKLGLARKRVGWNFQSPRQDYYHKLIFDPTLRHTEARVEHCTGETVLSASTKEWAIRNHLYSCTDVSASENIGRVLAERCLQSGLTTVFFDTDEVDQNSSKVTAFVKAFKDNNISLKEPDMVTPDRLPGIDYDSGHNRIDEPKKWKDDYQE